MVALKPDRAEIEHAASSVSQKLTAELGRAAAELRALVDERVAATQTDAAGLAGKLALKADRGAPHATRAACAAVRLRCMLGQA